MAEPLTDKAESTAEQQRALVLRWIEEGFNQRNLAVVDEVFAEHATVNGSVVGRGGLKRSMIRHVASFPDLGVRIDDIVADGTKVAIWYTAEGTHRGEFEGIPPTGKRVKWSGVDLLTFDGGKISAARFSSDLLGMLRQLGVTSRAQR